MGKKRSRKSNYHSTISRRDALKMLGLGAAAGVGAFKWNFNDLDEAIGSTYADRNLPWWVKEVDEPTVEIDWDIIERFDYRNTLFYTAPEIMGEEAFYGLFENMYQNTREGILNEEPGRSIRDVALGSASGAGWVEHLPKSWTGEADLLHEYAYVAYRTPEELGVPRWEGTPEENARMIRVAARYFGASDVGYVKLTEKTKKLIYTHDGYGKEIVFEDVEEGYETNTKKVLPNKDLWVIAYMVPQSLIMNQMGELGGLGEPSSMAYASLNYINFRLMTFLRGLGYQRYGGDDVAVGLNNAFGILGGLGEYARTNRMVSPKYGNAFRTTNLIITDLPLAETKPIDAGIFRFCHTCKKCAEMCPTGALSMADEPSWETKGPWNRPGLKGFYEDGLACFERMFSMSPTCGICHAVCPYNKMDKATIHELVKISIAKAPMMNGLIRTLDDSFGYGLFENPEDFWEMEDLPIYGLDPSRE